MSCIHPPSVPEPRGQDLTQIPAHAQSRAVHFSRSPNLPGGPALTVAQQPGGLLTHPSPHPPSPAAHQPQTETQVGADHEIRVTEIQGIWNPASFEPFGQTHPQEQQAVLTPPLSYRAPRPPPQGRAAPAPMPAMPAMPGLSAVGRGRQLADTAIVLLPASDLDPAWSCVLRWHRTDDFSGLEPTLHRPLHRPSHHKPRPGATRNTGAARTEPTHSSKEPLHPPLMTRILSPLHLPSNPASSPDDPHCTRPAKQCFQQHHTAWFHRHRC